MHYRIIINSTTNQADLNILLDSSEEYMIGYTQMDLSIAKYHFEMGSGKVNFEWV